MRWLHDSWRESPVPDPFAATKELVRRAARSRGVATPHRLTRQLYFDLLVPVLGWGFKSPSDTGEKAPIPCRVGAIRGS